MLNTQSAPTNYGVLDTFTAKVVSGPSAVFPVAYGNGVEGQACMQDFEALDGPLSLQPDRVRGGRRVLFNYHQKVRQPFPVGTIVDVQVTAYDGEARYTLVEKRRDHSVAQGDLALFTGKPDDAAF